MKRKIVRQYISKNSWRWNDYWDVKDIKSSVKVGIKNGLGAKFRNQIADDDMERILRELINRDLEKTNAKAIALDSNNIRKELDILELKIKEFNKPVDDLCEKKNKVIDDYDKKRKLKQKEISKIVVKELDKLVPKIKEEVVKSLIVDTLKENGNTQSK